MGFDRIVKMISYEDCNKKKDKYLYLKRLQSYYSGCVDDVLFEENGVKVIIYAPSSWRYVLLTKFLLPYRYI